LLVLDNFEQVTPAALLLTQILSHCPGVKMVVTSREILHMRIERVFVLQPLALPDLAHLPEPGGFVAHPSVALFLQRARAVSPDFPLTATNARTVAQICHRLDGYRWR